MQLLYDQQSIAFPVYRSDLAFWLHEPMPYILVIYDAQSDGAYWLYVQAYVEQLHDFNRAHGGETITVLIPKSNGVDDAVIRRFAQFKNNIVRQATEVIHDGFNHLVEDVALEVLATP